MRASGKAAALSFHSTRSWWRSAGAVSSSAESGREGSPAAAATGSRSGAAGDRWWWRRTGRCCTPPTAEAVLQLDRRELQVELRGAGLDGERGASVRPGSATSAGAVLERSMTWNSGVRRGRAPAGVPPPASRTARPGGRRRRATCGAPAPAARRRSARRKVGAQHQLLTKKPISASISGRVRLATAVPTHHVVLAGVAGQRAPGRRPARP